MSEEGPFCPFCGDGPEAIGTMYHIECVEKLMEQRAELQAENKRQREHIRELDESAHQRAEQAEATIERLTWMLNEAVRDMYEAFYAKSGVSEVTHTAAQLHDLERRWAERGAKP